MNKKQYVPANPSKNDMTLVEGSYVVVTAGNFTKTDELPSGPYAWVNLPKIMGASSVKDAYNANIPDEKFAAVSDADAAKNVRGIITHIVDAAFTDKVIRISDERGTRYSLPTNKSAYNPVTEQEEPIREEWFPKATNAVSASGRTTGYNFILPIRNSQIDGASLPAVYRVQGTNCPGVAARDMILYSYLNGYSPKGLGKTIVLQDYTVYHDGVKRQVDLFEQISMKIAGTWNTNGDKEKETELTNKWAENYF